jgi:hypothetical protein
MTIDPMRNLPLPRDPLTARPSGRARAAADRRGTMPCGRGAACCAGPE